MQTKDHLSHPLERNSNKNSPLYSHPNQTKNTKSETKEIENMEITDEQFIAQFAAMTPITTLALPQETVAMVDWTLSALAIVITDRNTVEANFVKIMMRAWGLHPDTTMKMITKNTFLIHFITEKDLLHVMHKGLWNYKEDAITTKRVHGPEDLEELTIENIEINTQWHHIPPEAVKKEGVSLMAEKIGVPISEVTDFCLSGNRVYKIRILLPLDKPLQNTLEVTHPTLGKFIAHIVYERVDRFCMFCANLGHDKTCPKRIRMLRLSRDPRFKDRPGMKGMTKDRMGPWINNQNSVPRPNWSREKDDTSGTNTVSEEKREKNYKNTNPNRGNSKETGAQSAKAHKANTEDGDNGSDMLESPIGSGLGVDLNYPDCEKAVNRRRKGKDLQMQIEVPSQTMAQKRMGT